MICLLGKHVGGLLYQLAPWQKYMPSAACSCWINQRVLEWSLRGTKHHYKGCIKHANFLISSLKPMVLPFIRIVSTRRFEWMVKP